MKTFILALALVFLSAGSSLAQQQPTITQYRLTRVTPAPSASSVVQKSAMTCNLTAGGVPASVGFRITNEAAPTTDCEMLGTIGGVIVPNPTGAAHVYTIAAAGADNVFGYEGGMANIIPPAAPTGGRVRPGLSVSATGAVQGRFPFGGLDIASVLLDDFNLLVYFGASTLTVPGYDVRAGDRFEFAFLR